MNKEEKLKNFALEVNELLSEYIHLHDKILKQAGRFISLFKKVDFKRLLNDCAEVSNKFRIKREEIFLFKKESGNDLNHNENKYLDQLILFSDKLLLTISLLFKKQQLLYKKSIKEKISWKEFNNAEKLYKRSIEDYLIEGQKLNDLNRLIFNLDKK